MCEVQCYTAQNPQGVSASGTSPKPRTSHIMVLVRAHLVGSPWSWWPGDPRLQSPTSGHQGESSSSGSLPGKRQCSHIKCLRTNLITIPDLNCTCLVSVQQNHFCPHGVVSAETPLHYLYFLFYSSGMFFRWGLSTWTAWGMEGKVNMWKTDSAGSSTVTSWYWGAAGWAWAAALPGSACTGLQHWLSVLKSLLLWVKDTAVNHTSPGTEIFFV